MQEQYLQKLLIDQEDNATINLLKCSENLEDYSKQTWDLKFAKTLIKCNPKQNITQIMKQRKRDINSKKNSINLSACEIKIQKKQITFGRQKLMKAQRRYSTEYEQPMPILPRKQNHHSYLQHMKTVDTNVIAALQASNLHIQKQRCNTVFIHMLKNKSSNLIYRKNQSNQNKIIHNLSGIKVRMMAKKMQQSKIMNFTYKELKSKLDRITTVQTSDRSIQKSLPRHNRIFLNEILSKRLKLRDIKQNLRLQQ